MVNAPPPPITVPLEGFEHDFSILHFDSKQQIPRNYAALRHPSDIQTRPKTANGKWNAGKKRAKARRLIGRSQSAYTVRQTASNSDSVILSTLVSVEA